MNNTARADEMAASARATLEKLGDDWYLSHVLDTQARIALARGAIDEAVTEASGAIELSERAQNKKAIVDALLTKAQAMARKDKSAESLALYEKAGVLAREVGAAGLTRKALREWADALAGAGLHQQAFELAREALAVS